MGLHGGYGVMGMAGAMGGHNEGQKLIKCVGGCKFYEGSKKERYFHRRNADGSYRCLRKEYLEWLEQTGNNPNQYDFGHWRLCILDN